MECEVSLYSKQAGMPIKNNRSSDNSPAKYHRKAVSQIDYSKLGKPSINQMSEEIVKRKFGDNKNRQRWKELYEMVNFGLKKTG